MWDEISATYSFLVFQNEEKNVISDTSQIFCLSKRDMFHSSRLEVEST